MWLGYSESFHWFSPLFNPGPKFCAVYDGDVDNDGDLDLYFSDYDSPLEDRLLINDGSGVFVDETATRFPTGANNSDFGTGNFICDFNLDGWDDILKGSGSFEPLKMLYNDGTGVFSGFQVLESQAVYMVRTADFDVDGRMDIYVVSDQQDYLLMNESTDINGLVVWNRVNITSSSRTQNFGGNVHVADVDRDGDPDPGVADVDVDIAGCNRHFALLQNDMPTGAGMSDPNDGLSLPWNLQGTHDYAFFDLDGDGFQDMFMATCDDYRVFRMVPFAALEAYGEGTLGSNGTPAIAAPTAPYLGNANFKITLENAVPGAVPVLAFSDARSTDPVAGQFALGTPLLTSCVAPAVGGGGTTELQLAIPAAPQLEGRRMYAQWAIPDAAGGISFGGNNYATSEGLELYLSANQL